jgi:transposase-like protein
MRKQFTNEFKARVAMASLTGDKIMGGLAGEFEFTLLRHRLGAMN